VPEIRGKADISTLVKKLAGLLQIQSSRPNKINKLAALSRAAFVLILIVYYQSFSGDFQGREFVDRFAMEP